MKFKLGDKVIHQKGNIPRRGEIIEAELERTAWAPHLKSNLAFYGENNYFEWLENAEPYLTLI